MSVYSGNSFSPSILKKSTLQDRLQSAAASATKVRFVIPHFENLRKLLQNYLENGLGTDFAKLIQSMKDPQLQDDEVCLLLREATDCIPLMNNDFARFVDALLSIKWAERNKKMVNEYQSFLVNLLVAHNCHAQVVIDHLLSLFIPSHNEKEERWKNGEPKEEDQIKCANIHSVLNTLLKVIPMCNDIFLNSLISHYPYFLRGPHITEYYLHNLLWVLDYQPWLRPNILHLIFSKLVLNDVEAPREMVQEVYSYDASEEIGSLENIHMKSTMNASTCYDEDIVETLDVCINRMFSYIFYVCHNHETQDLDWDNTKELYKDLLKVFDDIILPTYNCHHVQFCWFLMCGFKPTLAEAFIEHLWKKVTNPSVAAVIRQTSVQYIASLVARASYITLKMFKSVTEQLASWIHAYINTQDGLECVNSDVRVHSVFYSTCQALFYVTTFRHKEMVGSKKNMTFLQNLNFTKIVTSRLNPLRVCQPAVVQNFAAFTRNYQLAYCYSILEHNVRNVMPTVYQSEKGAVIQTSGLLDAYYPFDPLVLWRSVKKISPLYREYEESDISNKEEDMEQRDSEMDDFLDEEDKCDKFSYGASPGYKFCW